MPVTTISWEGDKDGYLKLIDQTRLPMDMAYLQCKTANEVWDAIKCLSVRGAPAIGIAGGFGLYLGVREFQSEAFDPFLKEVQRMKAYLASCRPTAVNLSWALDRIERIAIANREKPVEKIKELLLQEGKNILEEDRRICRDLGKIGASLVKNDDTLLTYCNAGGLATADYGTALAVIFRCAEEGKKNRVFSGETRPLLQGSRLTSWELQQAGINVTLICDNMIAHVMRDIGIDGVFVGADRIAANGDAANKIGTYAIAVLAEKHKVPFYVVAPSSTFDLSIASGKEIPIEERNSEEITDPFGYRCAPAGIQTYNPAFDVTPASLISAIVTEKGIIRELSESNIRKVLA